MRDSEISGTGNSYTAEYWQYDSRLGRRWNVDPVVKPWESPYAAFANNPIRCTDRKGADTASATSEASSFVQQSISPLKEVKRSWLGQLITGQKTKMVTNPSYQSEISALVGVVTNHTNLESCFFRRGWCCHQPHNVRIMFLLILPCELHKSTRK